MKAIEFEGVYLSETAGHLYVLNASPIRVTCIVCMETCDTSLAKNYDQRKKAADTFTTKHGYLGNKIADSILQLIPTSNEPAK
jgi:hypothetical protein